MASWIARLRAPRPIMNAPTIAGTASSATEPQYAQPERNGFAADPNQADAEHPATDRREQGVL
jgi:hypothetical protein